MRNYFCRLLLSIVFTWISDRTWVPIKEFLYSELEIQGILTVQQAKEYSLKSIINAIKEERLMVKLHGELPPSWEIFPFDEPYRNVPYWELMCIGNSWINKKAEGYIMMSYWEKRQFEYQHAVVKERVRLYDLMDDIKRPYVALYIKRVKFKQAKEILGVEKVDDFPKILPPIVPVEFMQFREP